MQFFLPSDFALLKNYVLLRIVCGRGQQFTRGFDRSDVFVFIRYVQRGQQGMSFTSRNQINKSISKTGGKTAINLFFAWSLTAHIDWLSE